MARILRSAATAVLAAAFLLPLSACGSPSAAPSGTPVATIPDTSGDPFTIVTVTDGSNPDIGQLRQDQEYLQELLRQKGWNVRLKLRGARVDSDTGDFLYSEVLLEDATNGSVADAYYIGFSGREAAQKLAEDGLVRNMSVVVKESAPVLYSRYRTYFEQDGSAVPAAGRRSVWGKPTVLYLKKEFGEGLTGQPMTMAKLLSLMEADQNLKIGFSGEPVLAAMSIWAGEQGYYPLRFGGMGASGLFAAVADPKCVPVPVESIAGFEGMFASVLRYTGEGRFFDLGNPETYAIDASGYAGPLDSEMDQLFLEKAKATGRDFVAIALQGCGAPRLPEDEPTVMSVLAVPIQSTNVGQLAAFVQWALTSRDGYGLVRYGAEGADYRMVGERIEFLNKGEAITVQDGEEQIYKAFFYRTLLGFYSEEMERATVYTADNYNQLSGMPPAEYPAFAAKALRAPDSALFSDIDKEFGNVIGDRNTFLNGYIYTEDQSQVNADAEKCLAALNALRDDTDRLAAAYSERIGQLLHE